MKFLRRATPSLTKVQLSLFNKQNLSPAHPFVIQKILERISRIKPILPTYRHEGEESINPAYTDIENCMPLCLDEKRIFVLRGDFILATGIKNVCVWEGNTDIFSVTDPMVHHHINRKDRYGHPSLAVPDVGTGYDGSVYYAGWLCQRNGHIKIFLQSGRFHKHDMTESQKLDIELFIVYQFMKSYGKQNIFIYDCDPDEKLSLFLADQLPSDKVYRLYTPTMLDALLAEAKSNEIMLYENKMAEVKQQMAKSLQRLLSDRKFNEVASQDCLEKMRDLLQDKKDTDSNSLSFDNVWEKIKNIFDQVIYHSHKVDTIDIASSQFKRVIRSLIEMGIPFVNGRNICVWSTRFARDQAVQFCEGKSMTVDGIAQEYLRCLLLGWPDGKLNVFYHLVKNPDPLFPAISVVFWNALSDVYVREISRNSEVHLFYQDALTVGNFFWEVELPIARKRNAAIILHQYDLTQKKWLPEARLDSAAGDQVYLRRRNLHSFEVGDPDLDQALVKEESGVKVWRQDFQDADKAKPMTNWTAPRIMTMGKMRKLARRWMTHAAVSRLSFFEHTHTALDAQECVHDQITSQISPARQTQSS